MTPEEIVTRLKLLPRWDVGGMFDLDGEGDRREDGRWVEFEDIEKLIEEIETI